MELPLSELLIVVASVLGVLASAFYLRARLGNSEINTKLKNRYLDYIGQLEEEVGNPDWAGANRVGMDGKFGNYHNGIFTPDFIKSDDITKQEPSILG